MRTTLILKCCYWLAICFAGLIPALSSGAEKWEAQIKDGTARTPGGFGTNQAAYFFLNTANGQVRACADVSSSGTKCSEFKPIEQNSTTIGRFSFVQEDLKNQNALRGIKVYVFDQAKGDLYMCFIASRLADMTPIPMPDGKCHVLASAQ